MKPIYLYDSGVKPWEQTATVSDSRFATITVVGQSVSDIFDLWLALASAIRQRFPRLLKWRTVGHSVGGSKLQELKLVKKIKYGLSNDDYLEKNGQSGIFSYVKQIIVPIIEFDLNTITQTRYTVLLFTAEFEPKISAIWEKLTDSDSGLQARGIESLLNACKSLIICRLFESDTHVSLQFIGEVEQVDVVLRKLSELNINRVVEREIAGLINDSCENPLGSRDQ